MKNNNLSKNDIAGLLNGQTKTILNAVDFKIGQVNQRLDKMDVKFDRKFDKLITTLDRFLKRLADLEDEFTMMKADINRLKTVIREKLGVVV